MNPSWLNTQIGIVAGLITIITGIVALVKTFKRQADLPPTSRPAKSPRPTITAASPTIKVKGVQEFVGDDSAYRKWLTEHPDGFVINTYLHSNPRQSEYVALHRARCRLISNFQTRAAGAFTEGEFMKACANDVESLRQWATAHGRKDGSFTSEKCKCKPV